MLDDLLIDSQFNIDVWYKSCKDFTFPTQFIDITQKEAFAIQLYFEQNTLKLPKLKTINFKLLSGLDKRIEECGKQMEAKERFFVRLSSRSPKDSGFGSQRMHELLTKELDKYNVRMILDPTEKQNMEWKAFFAAQINSLCVTTGSDAMQLLLDSERVYTDIKRAFDLYNMSGNWNICIAVRKWITHSIQGEFRGFVWKKKLTAISQYFDMVYFVDVKTKKEKYLQLINTFFAKVVNQIPYKDFIIDFSVELNGEVQMIELNPFTKFTSACLFNWNRDIAVLKGKKEFEFRILEAPLEAIREPQIQMYDFIDLLFNFVLEDIGSNL
eukprot:Phypoly_transcript_07962.p1 GENE.Phypoly_transcript_07962~~Phypoly_transcript_07962.p1  ORF type:complete len:326 (+),score=32.06 Phypoly_transcript_07962:279-1256(+)